jgi:LysM repeat protein
LIEINPNRTVQGFPPRKAWRIVLFALVALSVASGRDVSYVVKSHDTLFGIARENGISVSQLAQRNRIDRDSQIYVGQHLWIPSSANAVSKPAASGLAPSIQRAIEQAPVKAHRWKYIVIHHSGVDEGTLKGIDRYHREERHMEHGLAYHFLIGNGHGMGDGAIAVGDRWRKQLAGGHLHSEAQNQVALGICLIGNFDKTKPTARQLSSLESLIRALMKRCQLTVSAVKTHQQINVVHTRCPGTKFPARSFVAKLKQPAA